MSGCSAQEQHGEVLVFKHGRLAGPPVAMREILAGFEARHPGVSVVEELLPASTDQQHQYFAINL
ncbi:MAG TPA: hypothetical protein VFA38_06395, partial [Nitrospirales bacterium]|nr:hypothetical protein [Nitrospirales bacterium]